MAKDKFVSVPAEGEMVEKLDAIAKSMDMSKAWIARRAIESWLNSEEGKKALENANQPNPSKRGFKC